MIDKTLHYFCLLIKNVSKDNKYILTGRGGLFIHAAGTYGTIQRKQDDRVIVQMPSKRLFSFDQHCMAVVGMLMNSNFTKSYIILFINFYQTRYH